MSIDVIRYVRSSCTPGFRATSAPLVLAGTLLLSSQCWAATQLTPPDSARAMTSVELYLLYRNKSWKWNGGAGRMEDEGRSFKAWSGSGAGAVWATGRWSVTDVGLLCLKADWHTPSGAYPNETCFSHRISDQTIYQRKEPYGDWYIFKHAVPEHGDEFMQLVKEDLVSPHLDALTAKSKIVPDKALRPHEASAQVPSDKRPVVAPRSITFGAYDPHGDFKEDANSKIEHLFLPWEDVDLSTLALADQYALERGRALLITVEPWSWDRNWRVSPAELHRGIVNGRYDANAAAVCSETAKLKSPVTIRFAQEMDQEENQFTWAQWTGPQYIEVYRRFVMECRKHLPQATFMWSPKGNRNLRDYYPGDDVVDEIGLSVFGYQPYDLAMTSRSITFAERLKPGYDLVEGYGKPIVVAELGYEGDRDYVRRWAEDVTKQYPVFGSLTAVVYFNDREVYPWPRGLGLPDWRVVQHVGN